MKAPDRSLLWLEAGICRQSSESLQANGMEEQYTFVIMLKPISQTVHSTKTVQAMLMEEQ